jgi:protein tyrosine/serine phosphatase
MVLCKPTPAAKPKNLRLGRAQISNELWGDCKIGDSSLSARAESPAYEKEKRRVLEEQRGRMPIKTGFRGFLLRNTSREGAW